MGHEGINVTLSRASFDTVIGNAIACPERVLLAAAELGRRMDLRPRLLPLR